MMRKNLLRGFGVVGGLVLAAGWGILTLSGTALADHKDGHPPPGGGGGGEEEETVLFDVTTPDPESAIQIIGVFDPEGELVQPDLCNVIFGPAAGRSGLHRAIVSRPYPNGM